MIWRTRDNKQPTATNGVEVHPLPWLQYWQALEQMRGGTATLRFTAQVVPRMRMWQVLNWQPEAADRMLGWIATGKASYDVHEAEIV
jgi:hypothetical protein